MTQDFAPPGTHSVLKHAWVPVDGTPPVDPTKIALLAVDPETPGGLDVYWWVVVNNTAEEDDGE